jgi:predicted nucleic acid-binding protein
MNQEPAAPTGFVPDANVLIDYANTDKEILSLIVQHMAAIYIPSPVLAEVRQLPLREARRLGLQVLEPSLAEATEAAVGGGSISFQDRLCLIIARTNGWTCLTNDKPLRKACHGAAVASMWGLEAMRVLVGSRHLSVERASATAERIADTNRYITQVILRRFHEQIGR